MRDGTPDPAAVEYAEQAGIWCMRLADGELDAQERVEFERWLQADPHHRRAFDRAVSAWREIGIAEGAPEFLPLRVEALNSVRRAQHRRWAWRPGVRAAAAAAAAVAIAAGVLWRAQAPDVYRTDIGERRVVALFDGSALSLDADSRVDVRYARDKRELHLRQGRARFSVAHDPLRSFSVSAGNRVVVATGTRFSVELVEREVRVVLYEGSVSVLAGARGAERVQPLRFPDDDASADTALTPGRELVASLDVPEARVAAADPTRSLSWESGQLVFVDEPLASAVERVNRYARDRIELGDAKVGQMRVNGVFDAGDTVGFIEGVTAAFPVRVDMRDERFLLSHAGH